MTRNSCDPRLAHFLITSSAFGVGGIRNSLLMREGGVAGIYTPGSILRLRVSSSAVGLRQPLVAFSVLSCWPTVLHCFFHTWRTTLRRGFISRCLSRTGYGNFTRVTVHQSRGERSCLGVGPALGCAIHKEMEEFVSLRNLQSSEFWRSSSENALGPPFSTLMEHSLTISRRLALMK